MEKRDSRRQTEEGIVVSDKMDKTRVVQVERVTRHPIYGKVIRHSVKFKAHDELNQSKTGNRVRLMRTRPLSKNKRFRIVEVLS